MKLFSTYIYIGILFLTACQKELKQIPETTKVADNFYKTETELEEAVSAVYASLQSSGVYNVGIPALGEIPSEDVYVESPLNDDGMYGQIDAYNVYPQSGLISGVWKDSYITIQRANIVISRIDNVPYKDVVYKNHRIGEVKFIRALMYFNLVRLFGDVPLVTQEISDPIKSFGQVRSAVADIYAQIKTDLTEAIDVLPDINEKNKARVVKTAAQTLLGKVHLTLKEYQDAKNSLLEVVNSGKHSLLPETQNVFDVGNELNAEIIFSIQFASGINANTEGSDAYRMFNPSGRSVGNLSGCKGNGLIKKDLYDAYGTTDKRKDIYIALMGTSIAYPNKIAVPTTTVSDGDSDWVVLRYADVLLMLAEIENELGNSSGAANYVNKIRTRAGIGNYAGATDKVSLFNEIDMQRRKELIWEGHRWFDLLRQGRAKSVLGITDDTKLLMPIPANQIATDSALKQNPGY